jgi:hypothetical protein
MKILLYTLIIGMIVSAIGSILCYCLWIRQLTKVLAWKKVISELSPLIVNKPLHTYALGGMLDEKSIRTEIITDKRGIKCLKISLFESLDDAHKNLRVLSSETYYHRSLLSN